MDRARPGETVVAHLALEALPPLAGARIRVAARRGRGASRVDVGLDSRRRDHASEPYAARRAG